MSNTPIEPQTPAGRPDASPDPFRALVDQHARWVFAAAYRQLHDTHLAEDATQTVFILLHRRSPHMQPIPKLSGWLFNTLQFTIRNIRREQRRRAAREREIAAQRATITAAPETATDLQDQLDTAVAALSSTDRTAILLRFYQDLPFDKIAAQLQISEPAARKRVTRAIGALRKHLNLPTGESAATSMLALAATHGLSHAPITLPTTIAATSTAAAIPTATITTLKGVTTLMALAKLQTAAIVVAAALLLLIPTTFFVLHKNSPTPTAPPISENTSPQAPSVSPANTAPTLDDSLDTFNRLYALAPGQILKHIPPIDPDLRVALFKHSHVGVPRNGFDVVLWQNNEAVGSGNLAYPTYPLEDLATQCFRVQYPQLESSMRQIQLSGDFSYRWRPVVPPDQFIAPFKQILHDDFHLDPTIEFRDVPRKVLVLRGKWNYNPSPDLRPIHLKTDTGEPRPCLDFYSDPTTSIRSLRTTFCSGGADTIAATLAWWLHEDTFIEATAIPDRFATREPRSDNYDDSPFLQPEDRTALLQHFTQQTGLTVTEETRTVHHLFIDPAPPATAPAR